MELKKDWRAETSEFIRGERLCRKKYRAPSKEWDHDHCAACWAKFAEFEGLEILHAGLCDDGRIKMGSGLSLGLPSMP